MDREICVLGGGPAGSVIARRLAELGHAVVLIERATDQRPRAESLAPSILPVLDSLRLRGDVDTAVFCHEQHSLLAWEPGDVQVKLLHAAPSLLIERPLLGQGLRSAAARSGVDVITPAKARAVERAAGGGWLIPVVDSERAVVIKSKFLVDARGKRHSMGVDDGASRTVALSAQWDLVDK